MSDCTVTTKKRLKSGFRGWYTVCASCPKCVSSADTANRGNENDNFLLLQHVYDLAQIQSEYVAPGLIISNAWRRVSLSRYITGLHKSAYRLMIDPQGWVAMIMLALEGPTDTTSIKLGSIEVLILSVKPQGSFNLAVLMINSPFEGTLEWSDKRRMRAFIRIYRANGN